MARIEQYPYAAKDFVAAYANTNFLQILRGEALEKFYVDRGVHSELKGLLGELEAGTRLPVASNTKFLFVGHTGCGKSTELSRLVSLMEAPAEQRGRSLHNAFLPIHYSISEVVGLYNIEFVDIALSMMVGIYRAAEALGHVVDDTPARRVYDWLYQGRNDRLRGRVASSGMNGDMGISGLIKLIDVRLKGEGDIREEVRVRIKKFIPELIALINQVIEEVIRVTGKNILLIIDDLDKIQPLEDALKIFREHVKSLTSFNCFAIYTAPISLLYDPACKHVGQFLDLHYMPMFRVRSKDGQREPPTGSDVRILREIIYRRVHPFLFEEGVVDEAIDMTGGILRELIRILRGCCVYCQEYDLGKVTHNVLQKQKTRLKSEYYRMLVHEDYQSLQRVQHTKSRADVDMRHLESLCVLYYPNGKGWFDVHPIVRELLEEWETDMQTLPPG
jgi:energy-coupling factor transporter ATP-binding protein EcfA2